MASNIELSRFSPVSPLSNLKESYSSSEIDWTETEDEKLLEEMHPELKNVEATAEKVSSLGSTRDVHSCLWRYAHLKRKEYLSKRIWTRDDKSLLRQQGDFHIARTNRWELVSAALDYKWDPEECEEKYVTLATFPTKQELDKRTWRWHHGSAKKGKNSG